MLCVKRLLPHRHLQSPQGRPPFELFLRRVHHHHHQLQLLPLTQIPKVLLHLKMVSRSKPRRVRSRRSAMRMPRQRRCLQSHHEAVVNLIVESQLRLLPPRHHLIPVLLYPHRHPVVGQASRPQAAQAELNPLHERLHCTCLSRNMSWSKSPKVKGRLHHLQLDLLIDLPQHALLPKLQLCLLIQATAFLLPNGSCLPFQTWILVQVMICLCRGQMQAKRDHRPHPLLHPLLQESNLLPRPNLSLTSPCQQMT